MSKNTFHSNKAALQDITPAHISARREGLLLALNIRIQHISSSQIYDEYATKISDYKTTEIK